MLVGGVGWAGLGTVEEVRVAGYFTELGEGGVSPLITPEGWRVGQGTYLHDDVHQPRLALLLARQTVNSIDILLQHAPVPLALEVGKADIDVDFLL